MNDSPTKTTSEEMNALIESWRPFLLPIPAGESFLSPGLSQTARLLTQLSEENAKLRAALREAVDCYGKPGRFPVIRVAEPCEGGAG